MNLPDLKHLDKIIALCRKRGVQSIEIDNIKLTLGPELVKAKTSTNKKAYVAAPEFESPEALSDEEMLFWSAGGPLKQDNDETKKAE